MLTSILTGSLIGLIYGLFFWHEKRRALSITEYNEKKLRNFFILKFSLRLLFIIIFFLFLLLLKTFNPILVLISMLVTFWLVLLKKERVI